MNFDKIKNEVVSIVFISDNNYAVNTGVAIASLKHNRNEETPYRIYLISDGISKEVQKEIHSMEDTNFCIDIIDYTNNIQGISKKGSHVSTTSLAKFFLADILCDCDKVIYLDGDVIIQEDLKELYDIDIENYYAAVVRDIIAEQMVPSIMKRLHSNLQYYFNSGMMLLNLKKIRKDNLGEVFLEYKRSGINYFMDQDALNVVFDGNIYYLPCKYNYMITLIDQMKKNDIPLSIGLDLSKTEMERIIDVCIIHLAGEKKPWKVDLPYATDIFMKYYKMSPFSKKEIFHLQKDTGQYQQYLFPFELIEKGSKIAIWGAGKVGTAFYNQVKFCRYCDIIFWVDEGYREPYLNKKGVVSPENIKTVMLDYIVIAVKKESVMEVIKKQIFNLQDNCENVIWRYPVISFSN